MSEVGNVSNVIVARSSRRRPDDIEAVRSAAFPGRLVVMAPTRASTTQILAALRGQLSDDELAEVAAALGPDQQEQ